MSQKMYFLADDKQGKADLWVTDGTTTTAVGGLVNLGVAGTSDGGLGPEYITVFGEQVIFAGEDALDDTESNGIWLTDGTPGGTTEVGGVSPGTGHASPFVGGSPNGLNPTNFVTFGSKAIFFGNDASNFTGLWVTDGTPGNTVELGGLENGQIVGKGANLSPENITAFNNSVLFDAFDASGFKGLWISDGTTGGTVEMGGSQNQGIFDSGTSTFEANDFITLGSFELFNAPNKEGDNALWITDGTANGTVEIGGVNNAGIVGADNTDLGNGLANSVRLGNRIFFSGNDNGEALGLWTTDGTASGTIEIGGLEDAGLTAFGQHPSSVGLKPTDLTVNGPQVLFNGHDAIGYNELWASDGTAQGTYEIGGEGVGGFLANEASDGLSPTSIVSLGNGKAVFIGDDASDGEAPGKPSLWVTQGTFATTEEIGGDDNLGVANISLTGFDFTDSLIGGDGLAYFVGANAAGNQVLWETDGTLGGTKVVKDTNNLASASGISPANMTMGPVPVAATNFSAGGETINLESVPGEEVDLSNTGNVADTVTGSNGTINLSGALASLIGGGLLVEFIAGVGNAVNLSNTKGNKDSIYGSKGTVTLDDAQANVIGFKDTITFAAGTTGNVVYLSGTDNIWDTVNGSGGTIYFTDAQASVFGGGDTIDLLGTTGNQVSLYSTAGNWDAVNGDDGTIYFSDAQASVFGGGDTIDLLGTTGNQVSLYATAGDWDTLNGVSGGDGVIYFTNAQASVVGGGDTIDLLGTTGDQVSLYATAGDWDYVSGSSARVYLTDAQTSVVGGGNTIILLGNSGNSANLAGTSGSWDVVSGSNGTLGLYGAQVSILGGSDTINFGAVAGNAASLYATAGNWDTVNGVSGGVGTVYFSDAQASVFGGGDMIELLGTTGNQVSLYTTAGDWDAVNGSDATIYFTNAQGSVFGGGNAINLLGSSGNQVSLYSTSGNWDTVNGSNGTVYLTGAQASLVGSGDTIDLYGVDTVGFKQAFGHDTINGFVSTDVLKFSASDQGLLSVSQSGANALISLDANDVLTLTNVLASSLTASQLHYG